MNYFNSAFSIRSKFDTGNERFEKVAGYCWLQPGDRI